MGDNTFVLAADGWAHITPCGGRSGLRVARTSFFAGEARRRFTG